MKERLKLVTDFGELRAGMIVVVGPCVVCNERHRGMLTEQNADGWSDINGNVFAGGTPLWRFLPKPICSGSAHAVFTKTAVDKSRVWRVEDGLEDSQQTPTTVSKRKGVRA